MNWFHKDKPAIDIPVGVLSIPLDGSLQNAAWSPDGTEIVFTCFRGGYNEGPASVHIYNLFTFSLRTVVDDGSDNVTQPGSTWVGGKIAFSSDRDERDEVWSCKLDTKEFTKITSRSDQSAYEPSFSPDGKFVVFESHAGKSRAGQIVIASTSEKSYEYLTDIDVDARQPNWSPHDSDLILYQVRRRGRWEIETYRRSTRVTRDLTSHLPGEKTDATFSPDGQWILYSGQRADSLDGLQFIPVNGGAPVLVPHGSDYYGAASLSPDDRYIVAETSKRAPEGGPGTKLEILRAR